MNDIFSRILTTFADCHAVDILARRSEAYIITHRPSAPRNTRHDARPAYLYSQSLHLLVEVLRQHLRGRRFHLTAFEVVKRALGALFQFVSAHLELVCSLSEVAGEEVDPRIEVGFERICNLSI